MTLFIILLVGAIVFAVLGFFFRVLFILAAALAIVWLVGLVLGWFF